LNVVDVIIILGLVAGFITGFRRGFIMEVALILGAVVALAVAKLAYPDVRHQLSHVAAKSPWLSTISYLGVFLIGWAAIMILARVARRTARLLMLGTFDRLGGAVVGVLQSAILLELLLYLGKRVPNHTLHHAITHSMLGPAFLRIVPVVDRLFPHVPYH
jgi:membrane protein required for colicin V production